MAIDNQEINLSAIKAETGINSNKFSELVGAASLNKFSFYAPGALSVDANKDIIITPPAANLKIGDFRSYNHLSNIPSAQVNYTRNWNQGEMLINFTQAWFPEAMNIKEFVVPGDYVAVKFYLSSADRTSEINPIHTQISPISFAAITPLPGHTRQTSYRPVSTQTISILNFPVGWLTTPDCPVYCETYISDAAGIRKINLGERSRNYTTINFHQAQAPYAYGRNMNNPYPPSGYTAIFPALHSAATPVCSAVAQVNQTPYSTTYNFYVFAKAVFGSSIRIIALTSVDLILTIGGVRTVMAQGVPLNHQSGRLCNGTIAGGGSWNDIGEVTFENGVVDPVPAFTSCP